MRFVNDWPARHARATPEKLAVTDASRGVARTYADLDRRAGGLARFLSREAGVGARDRVAVLAETRVETVEAFFAVARLRATLVPLNAKLAAPELAAVLLDARPRVLLHSAAHAALARALLAALAAATGEDAAPLLLSFDDPAFEAAAIGPRDGVPAEAVVEEDDPWLVLYTSGSTGRPKGALVTHRQVHWNAVQTLLACDLTAEDATITYTPLFYTGGWNVLSTPLWYRGGTVHLEPGFDAARLLARLAAERIEVFFGVPTTLAGIAREPAFAAADLSALRAVLCGGAACPAALLEAWAAKGVALRPGYGLTEVGPNSFGVRPGDPPAKLGSIGRPNLHLEALVADDAGRPLPAGEEGELRLRGPTVFGGYLGNPAATGAALDAEGWFRTGDIVRADADGFYWLVGRRNDMFKSGGEKVYAGEVEAALAAHPAVAEAVVFGVPDERWGEVGRAVVVPRPGAPLSEEELRVFAAGRIAKFKVPKTVVLVASLPRLETGKVARPLVKRMFSEHPFTPAPERSLKNSEAPLPC
jgi:fatty-acyl-CoA synthase